MKSVLTIAGSDSSGGAGIQADIKTLTMHRVFATSVITAVTAQNTCGVARVEFLSPEMIESQLISVMEDIFPDAVKIGMVGGKENVEILVKMLKKYQPKNIVVDTVMVSTSGYRLLKEEAMDTLCTLLLPLSALATPNIPEAEILSGISIHNKEQMEEAARIISQKYQGAVLVKGGHQTEDADDVLCQDGKLLWFHGRRIHNPNTHGTGCTLSSAIACGLAKGMTMEESIRQAKEYLSGALAAGLDLGKGSGPLDHCYRI